jgi:hypothetical protein
MAQTAEQLSPLNQVRRVGPPDLQDIHRWLLPRLKARWPHLQDGQLLSWLHGCIAGNENFFVRYPKAVALFQVQKEFFDPRPMVIERFVIADVKPVREGDEGDIATHNRMLNNEALEQACMLYEDVYRWAQIIGAGEVVVDKFTDVPFEDKSDKDNENTIRRRMAGRFFEGREIFLRMPDQK